MSFPTGFKASASMKGLIRGLLADIENRFGYDHLMKHSFFKDVQWSSLTTGSSLKLTMHNSCATHARSMRNTCTTQAQHMRNIYKLTRNTYTTNAQHMHNQYRYNSCATHALPMYNTCTTHTQLMRITCTNHTQLMHNMCNNPCTTQMTILS